MLVAGLWAVLGAVLGSTATAAIYRLPRAIPLGMARSCCPHCETALRPWQLVPVLSWLIQRAQCRHCGGHILALYPAVEVGSAIAGFGIWLVIGEPVATALYLLLGVTLLTIAVIDAQHLLIPDVLSLLVLLLATIAAWRGLLDPIDALLGAVAGFATLALLRAWWRWRRGVEGIGIGDLRLIAGIGAWSGLEAVFVVLGLAGVFGIVIEVGVRGRRSGARLPLGTYLCLAYSVIAMWVLAPQS